MTIQKAPCTLGLGLEIGSGVIEGSVGFGTGTCAGDLAVGMEEVSCRCAARLEPELSWVDTSWWGDLPVCPRLEVDWALSFGLERSLSFIVADKIAGRVAITPTVLPCLAFASSPGDTVLLSDGNLSNDEDPPKGADLMGEPNTLVGALKSSSPEKDPSSGVFSLRYSSICALGTVPGRILGAFGRFEVLLGDIIGLFETFLPSPLSPILGRFADGESPDGFLPPDLGELFSEARFECPCRGV